MADQKNLAPMPNSSQEKSKTMDNILQLNDDCLNAILRYLSLIELCDIAETCSRFNDVARMAFTCRRISYKIPDGNGIKFKDNERILKVFGDLVVDMCIIYDSKFGIGTTKMIIVCNWLEKYCADTLEDLIIFGMDEVDLPASSAIVMSKIKNLKLMLAITDKTIQTSLGNCKNLIELNMMMYDGRFQFPGHRFPHLQKLSHRVRVDSNTKFEQIETFFKNHTKLIELSTQFLTDGSYDGGIDLTFIKHLVNLEKLDFILGGARVKGVNAFTHLKNLKELSIDNTNNHQTDLAILKSLASLQSLMKLELGISEVDDLIPTIKQLKNLSTFSITDGKLTQFRQFDVDVSCLAQLRDIPLTELKISCRRLLKPKSIVNIVRQLSELKTVKLFCEVALTESIRKCLVTVCSSQKRKIHVILQEEIIENMDFDFNFISEFNKEHGRIVEFQIEK